MGSNPSHLLDRQADTPASSQGNGERLAAVEPACPSWQGGVWTARPQTHEVQEQQGQKESNPLRLLWRQATHPGAHPCRSTEQTEAEVRVELTSSGLTVRCPAAGLLCRTSLPTKAVPAAGVEPAAFAFSARRSHHLSYTGMRKRPWWESNPRRAALQAAASPLGLQDRNRAGGGSRTHFVRVTRAVPGPSSIAGIERAARTGVEPARPKFKASVPSREPGWKSTKQGG